MQRLGSVLPAVRVHKPNGVGTKPTSAEKVCPTCSGAGWIRKDVPVGDPDFGRAIMCTCLLAEIEQRTLAEFRANSNLTAMEHLTFDTFDPKVPGVGDAFAAAVEFARDPRGWLVLYGGFGVGKTHLAAAIAHELAGRRTSVLFQVVPALLNEIRATFSPNNPVQQHELFNAILRANVLILDDLGEEHDTPWVREQLYLIFNHRYNQRMPTVVTTNRDIEKIDPRISSRMFDQRISRTVHLDALDFRPSANRRVPRPRR